MLRRRSWPWVVLAPAFVLMALVSTVESAFVYRLQLGGFSLFAAAALLLGIAGILGRPWAASGLRVLACVGAAYFLGAAVVIVAYGAWGSIEKGHMAPLGASVLVGAMAALPGLLFVRAAGNLALLVKPVRQVRRSS